MRVAVDRRALEINRRISDVDLHHPPILVEFDDGKTLPLNNFPLPRNRDWHVVYRPETPWIWVNDEGQPMAFNVWIEDK